MSFVCGLGIRQILVFPTSYLYSYSFARTRKAYLNGFNTKSKVCFAYGIWYCGN